MADFKELLRARKFTNAADMDKVCEMYQANINATMCSLGFLKIYGGLRGRNPEVLAKSLPLYSRLHTLMFVSGSGEDVRSERSEQATKLLASAISKVPGLTALRLDDEPLTENGIASLVQALLVETPEEQVQQKKHRRCICLHYNT